LVIGAGALLMTIAAAYDIEKFSITTDVDALISRKLPWHQRQLAFSQAFPQRGILAVVSAKTHTLSLPRAAIYVRRDWKSLLSIQASWSSSRAARSL
jgi:hypothetical protein